MVEALFVAVWCIQEHKALKAAHDSAVLPKAAHSQETRIDAKTAMMLMFVYEKLWIVLTASTLYLFISSTLRWKLLAIR